MGKKTQCKKSMKYSECELEILRTAVDEAEKKMANRAVNTPEVQKIMEVVEDFLRNNKLMCYGGTAINNILPLEDQFYDRSLELPDYDFYSPRAREDCKKLVDIYYNLGYEEVEGKSSSMHPGTYKVFVNYIPVADISEMNKKLFDNIYKDSKIVNGIHYAPPNFLRMAMYLELSRPAGVVSRWEKVLKRLILLNKNYPLKADSCMKIDTQRKFEGGNPELIKKIYFTTREAFINNGLVFFGGYANMLYSQYMPKSYRNKLREIPDFDVLSKDPKKDAEIVKERLEEAGIMNVNINKFNGVGEIIAPHYEITVKVGNKDNTIAFIYEPLGCHSYNKLKINNKCVKIATIDTMLSLYLAFYYADRDYYDKDRILCMSKFLFEVQQKNRLKQDGLLSRFSITCFGKQDTLESLRYIKAEKWLEFKNKENKSEDPEYLRYFFKYEPSKNKKTINNKKTKAKTKKNKK